ncbi:MAG: hypothetical protein K2H86_04160 [Muribaculaceae bacterium]|nr:hypothetical protein [Muribaculaceae bacterium]
MKSNLRTKIMLLATVMTVVGSSAVFADDYEDDIYYNPKKDNTIKRSSKGKSNYISNFQDQDVDSYNRRGQYYITPVDTIGASVSNGEDFVYTQAIQNYYNPTIVVDNAELLADVLYNSYGNVDVVFNYLGVPEFVPPYVPRSSWYLNFGPLSIGLNDPWWWPSTTFGWNYGWNYGWGPSWSWGYNNWYNPVWGGFWNPGWWGPSWGWVPGPSWGAGRPHYDYRPGGRVPVGPRPGWAGNTRPGNGRHPGSGIRPGDNTRPATGPGHNGHLGVMGNGSNGGHRNPASGYMGGSGSSTTGGRGNGSGVTIRPGGNSTVRPSGSTTINKNNSGYNSSSHDSGSRGHSTYNSGSNSNRGSYSSGSNRGSYSGGSRGTSSGGSRGSYGGHSGGGRGGRR